MERGQDGISGGSLVVLEVENGHARVMDNADRLFNDISIL